MHFSLHISFWPLALTALCFLAAITASLIGLRNMRAFARKGKRMMSDSSLPGNPDDLPGVSIIVYAKNVEVNIREFLNTLLNQQYPEFEVIVVNDASIDNTAEIVDTMLAEHPNLKYSFVPDSSRNVSRRKVAFTLGAKAASHPVLLLVNADSEIPSLHWMRRMAGPFSNPEIEVVLGISTYPKEKQRKAGRWYRQFDTLTTLSQWVGSALAAHPYRGDAYSLAFRRSTFFEKNGFAETNRFVAGEDDIFINSIATPSNTDVVLHPEAIVTQSIDPEEYPRLRMRAKERYTFTARYLSTSAFRRQGLLSLCQWLTLLSAVGAALSGWPNLLPGIISVLITILLFDYEICLYRRAATIIGDTKLFWSVPLFWLIRPLVNAFMRIRFRANKSTNYTWQH